MSSSQQTPSRSGKNKMQPPAQPIGTYTAVVGEGDESRVVDRPIFPVDSNSKTESKAGDGQTDWKELLNNVGPMGFAKMGTMNISAQAEEDWKKRQREDRQRVVAASSSGLKKSGQGSSSSSSGRPGSSSGPAK